MHRIIQGDVTQGVVDCLMRGARASVVYSDPPWGQGNLQYWRTYNGEFVRPDWMLFLTCFVSSVTNYCDGPAFVEMGLRWSDEVAAMFGKHGWREAWRVVVGYGPKKTPKHVLALTKMGDPSPTSFIAPSGNEWVVNRAMAASYAIPGGILLDPCLGLGRSAQCFADCGMIVYGSEMNPKRLSQAARRLKTTIQERT